VTIVHVPELYCPFPPAVNRAVDLVDAGAVEWARQWYLLPTEAAYVHLSAARLGWLAARTHPRATQDALQLVADWLAWFFIRDDYWDDVGLGRKPDEIERLDTQLLAVLHHGMAGPRAEPLAGALADLWQRTRQVTSSRWQARFVSNLEAFFQAGRWEAANRVQADVPSVLTYIAMRPFTGGLYAYLDLYDWTERIDLPAFTREHPAMVRLRLLANHIVCWTNDLLSFAKESQQQDVHNLVLTLRHHHRISLQEAIDRAVAIHDSDVREFIDTASQLPTWGVVIDAQVHHYVTVLSTFIRGHHDWAMLSQRYIMANALGA